MEPTRRGLMLVLSSPSGAGKTTLARRLRDAEPGIEMSISCTTREQTQGRGRWEALSLRRSRHVCAHARSRRVSRMGGGVRQLLWHAARAGREGARGRARRPVRCRLAGRAQSLRERAPRRRGHGVHPAAARGRRWRSASRSAPRTPRRSWRRACTGQATRSSTGTTMTTSSSITTWSSVGGAPRHPRRRALARLAAHRAQGLRAEPLGRALAPASVAVLSKSRHTGVSRYPVICASRWIPTFVGMTQVKL